MKNNLFLVTTLLVLILVSCQSKRKTIARAAYGEPYQSILTLKYAKGFTVHYYEGFKLVTVRDWKDTAKVMAQYILCSDKRTLPASFSGAVIIQTPITRTICISTTHIAELATLKQIDKIIAVTGVPLIYNTDVQQYIRDGKISNLGNEEINYERLVELAPDFVFTSGSYDGGDKLNVKLRMLRIPSVLNLDYMEQEPLARAEWLKFVAVFFDKEALADSLFRQTEARYLQYKQMVLELKNHPTVFCNLPYKEIWYMPCGENYIAKLIEDAGGNFLWRETTANNGLNLNLDYEAVYHKAADADIWLHPGFAESLEDLKRAHLHNTYFKAWKDGRVFNNNLRNTPAGGFDFWESGIVSPDIILYDLMVIFHPDTFSSRELFYYRQLN